MQSTALFAIASGLTGFQQVGEYRQAGPATVSIVDAQGRVRASASFEPPPEPAICPCRTLLQSPVRTAAGAVYFADRTGAVHKLSPDGSTAVVATFPLTTAQQMLAYAVSPDGKHLIATVLSTPPLHDPLPRTLGDPLFQEGGRWTLMLQTADAGGSTTTTLQRDLGTTTPHPTQIVGWDEHGPLATLNTNLAAQQAPPSTHLFGAALIHLAADGTHLDVLGGPDCTPVDALPDGTVACSNNQQQFTVRSSSGASLWQVSLPSDNYYYGLWLSPDANAVAVQSLVVTRTAVASAVRQANSVESRLTALGWLDANTVFEGSPSGELSLYDAHSLIKIRDLGVSGIFEGIV